MRTRPALLPKDRDWTAHFRRCAAARHNRLLNCQLNERAEMVALLTQRGVDWKTLLPNRNPTALARREHSGIPLDAPPYN